MKAGDFRFQCALLRLQSRGRGCCTLGAAMLFSGGNKLGVSWSVWAMGINEGFELDDCRLFPFAIGYWS